MELEEIKKKTVMESIENIQTIVANFLYLTTTNKIENNSRIKMIILAIKIFNFLKNCDAIKNKYNFFFFPYEQYVIFRFGQKGL